MLKLTEICRTYTDGVEATALSKVTLEIKQGEFVAIKGPSGCGKSSLLNIIGLLDVPDSGKYLLDEQDVGRLSDRARARIRNQTMGFVFQSFNLLTRTTTYDNVILPLQYARAKDAGSKVERALSEVGLWEKRRSGPNQLSGGEQQRVAIARALVNNPEVILADEPTGNLDSKTGLNIMNLLKNINSQGKTIIVVTHNEELMGFASRIVSMRDGKIEGDNEQ